MLRAQSAAAGRGVDLKVVRLPDDKDPCDLLAGGRSGRASRPEWGRRFLLGIPGGSSALEGADMSSAAGKDKVVAELAPVFAAVQPSAERDEQVRRWRTGSTSPSTCSRHCSNAPARAPRQPAPLASASGARRRRVGTLGASVPRDVRFERRAGPRVPRRGSRTTTCPRTCCAEPATGSWSTSTHRPAGLGPHDAELMHTVSEIVVRASSEPADRARARGRIPRARAPPARARASRSPRRASDYERQRELSVERSGSRRRLPS